MTERWKKIWGKGGHVCSLESRLEYLAEEQPQVLGRVLAALLDFGNVGDQTLRDCGVLDDDEFTND